MVKSRNSQIEFLSIDNKYSKDILSESRFKEIYKW